MISVIIPIYNVSQYLPKCIESVLAQTYTDLQIVLVDDGSTDGSAEICDIYKEKDSRILVVHKENGGLVSARKAGLQVATGTYVGYVDGDDWIEKDMYETLLCCMKEYDVDVVDADYFEESEGENRKNCSKLGYGCFTTEHIIPYMMYDKEYIECRLKPFVCSKLFKREMLESVQMAVNEHISCGEDAAVTYPYILKSKKIYITEYAGYHYVQRMNSITYIRSADELKRNSILINFLKREFGKSVWSNILLEELNQYAKLILLLRNIEFFDKELQFLAPFGGLVDDSRVIVYGAGKLGQSVCRYIMQAGRAEMIDWVDRDYLMYRKRGMSVNSPFVLTKMQGCYDVILVAVSNKRIAESIRNDLVQMKIPKEKIVGLTEDFMNKDNDVLQQLID